MKLQCECGSSEKVALRVFTSKGSIRVAPLCRPCYDEVVNTASGEVGEVTEFTIYDIAGQIKRLQEEMP